MYLNEFKKQKASWLGTQKLIISVKGKSLFWIRNNLNVATLSSTYSELDTLVNTVLQKWMKYGFCSQGVHSSPTNPRCGFVSHFINGGEGKSVEVREQGVYITPRLGLN